VSGSAASRSPCVGDGRAISAAQLSLDHWALSGHWTVEEELVLLGPAGSSVTFRYHARDINLVLAPPASGAAVRFTLGLDGRPPGDDHGIEVDESGEGTVDAPRRYELVHASAAAR
jgi:hypothetical protein